MKSFKFGFFVAVVAMLIIFNNYSAGAEFHGECFKICMAECNGLNRESCHRDCHARCAPLPPPPPPPATTKFTAVEY